MEFYFEKLYGDLTRIGYFPERDFGWQIPQSPIPDAQFKDYSLADADIVVIGDSFSLARVWQTKLIDNNLKVSTFVWKDLKTAEKFPSNLAEVLRASGFKGRYVIIESVERLFQKRMQSLANASYPLVKTDIIINNTSPFYPFTERERFSLNSPNGGRWGTKALYNKIKLSLHLPDNYLKSDAVQVVSFDGCQLFSHRLCHYAIFVDGDFKKQTFISIANVLTVNKSLQAAGMQPIWAIVPDKATVYLGYGILNEQPYQNIWQLLSQYPELTAPDLGELFIQKSRTIKDFYKPDDTHLSINGYLYMGDIINNALHTLQTNPTKPL